MDNSIQNNNIEIKITKRSQIWEAFKVDAQDSTKAVCNLCNAKVSRGGQKLSSHTTTNLYKHIEQYHNTELYKYIKKTSLPHEKEKEFSQDDNLEQITKHGSNPSLSSKSKQITEAIAKMFIMDFQPFSLVEDQGFRRLIRVLEPRYELPCRKHFSTTVLPRIFSETSAQIQHKINTEASYIACTTDLWESAADESYISFTIHYIDDHFKRVNILLATPEFPWEHSGANIAETIIDIITKWNMSSEKVTCVVHDNARNMSAGVREAKLQSIFCINHKLLSAQDQLKLPQHRLLQHNATRWNSTLYMLRRFRDQKLAINQALPETTCTISQITKEQWALIDQLVFLLEPFELETKTFENDSASLSQVIPTVSALIQFCSVPIEGELKTIRQVRIDLHQSLVKRVGNLEQNEPYQIATVLDPRFKLWGFTAAIDVEQLKTKVCRVIDGTAFDEPDDSIELNSQTQTGIKKVRKNFDIWESLDEHSQKEKEVTSKYNAIQRELREYLADNRLPRNADPLDYWRHYKRRFPKLSQAAKKYLAIPPSSSVSERVFSASGNVVTDKRNKLLPENVNMLVFLNNNLPVIDRHLNKF